MKKNRPKHLALWQIRLPIPGIVSILHRISGVLLFIAIPILLYWLEASLSSEKGYQYYLSGMIHPFAKIFILLVLWAFLHHAIAGVRFLLLDIHRGLALKTARNSAKAVLVISLLLTLFLGMYIW